MSLTRLTLSLNEDFRKNPNYTDYNTAANECISFFEGVYEYGCPGKRFTVCFPGKLLARKFVSNLLKVNFYHHWNAE